MVYCSVACCSNGNHNRKDLSYFTFPSDKRLGTWIKFCRRADKKFAEEAAKAKTGKANNLRICSAHFSPEAYRKTLNGRRETHDTALPTLFRPKHDCTPRSARYKKSSKRRRLESNVEDNACLANQLPLAATDSEDLTHFDYSYADFSNVEHDHPYCLSPENDQTPKRLFEIPEPEKVKSVGCQTDISTSDFEKLEDEVKNLKKRLADKNTLKRDLFMDDVLKNDDSVKFYTGIPSLGCFNLISDLLKPQAEKLKYWDKNKGKQMKYQTAVDSKPGPKRGLTLKEELIVTLVRLRLGLMGRQLADIFSVSQSQLSRIFTTWVCFLATVLKEVLVLWPSQEEVKGNLPRSFSKYPNTRVIIDCTEMYIEKPTSPYAQRATWSEYKGHNTIKALVGITPSGYFSFLSKFWTGSTSDRKITQESGLKDLLEEGDSVMADRGFNIRDILTKRKVYLNIPPFSKKGKQLSRAATKFTRQIARVRIHVERAIERLKDFKIFQGNLPLTLAPLADQMLIVCGALCNLLKPLAR
ncbi:hypothetical protein AWC38_SpisGene12253 [Stylophora pistillata]|uniref:THAP-type domain-containing protein n=1 Tax=Stylophora pistillata TaxID=50429 RepID=A0A2B4S2B2_STYPI|nr:hypothetical protein AWC38_SpisGene12253 [Stylophora pistillata]